jgi:hypothetical protein
VSDNAKRNCPVCGRLTVTYASLAGVYRLRQHVNRTTGKWCGGGRYALEAVKCVTEHCALPVFPGLKVCATCMDEMDRPKRYKTAFFTTHVGPECPECKSIMIPHGAGLKCVNCGCTKARSKGGEGA